MRVIVLVMRLMVLIMKCTKPECVRLETVQRVKMTTPIQISSKKSTLSAMSNVF